MWAIATKTNNGYDIKEYETEETARKVYESISRPYYREEYYLFEVKGKKALGEDLGEHYDIKYGEQE